MTRVEAAAPVRRSRARLREAGPVLAVIAVGGGLGALARYGIIQSQEEEELIP